MNKTVTFRGMEHSPVIEEFAQKHLARLDKLLESERTPIYIDLVLEAYPNHAHNQVKLILKTPHYELVAHHEGPELYQEIDRVTDKMMQEIRRAKEKLHDDLKKRDSYKSV